MGGAWTDVVAVVIYNPDGGYLLAQRPAGKVYAGYWEFPGGKVESGESLEAAVKREIREELGIEVRSAQPWLVRTHVYEHASVRLHFFRTRDWSGTLRGLEGQDFTFQTPGRETVAPMLPANGPILKSMSLPALYGVTQAAPGGADAFMLRLESALAQGLRLVQVRAPELQGGAFEAFARAVVARCHEHGARALVNRDPEIAIRCGADGVHLSAHRLMDLKRRPDLALVGASVHNRLELDHAAAIGCDLAVLGSVLSTASHPQASTLGWEGFAAIASNTPIPVYGIGGLSLADIYPQAWAHGAHGIAAIRAVWS